MLLLSFWGSEAGHRFLCSLRIDMLMTMRRTMAIMMMMRRRRMMRRIMRRMMMKMMTMRVAYSSTRVQTISWIFKADMLYLQNLDKNLKGQYLVWDHIIIPSQACIKMGSVSLFGKAELAIGLQVLIVTTEHTVRIVLQRLS